MITNEMINAYIEKIPPSPKVVRATLQLLNEGELIKASQIAQTDLALSSYLKHIVNTPSYGFKNEVKEISQIFGILGVSRSQQSVYNYMLSLLSPKEWKLFTLNQTTFYNLQADFSSLWKKILEHLEIEDKTIESSISLLPASIIVTEALFREKKTDVELLRSVDDIDFNTILQRLCGVNLFNICEKISLKWDMPEMVSEIIYSASGKIQSQNKQIAILGKWMHLLLFYTLSKPQYIKSGLNDFLEFKIEYVEDIYEDFSKLMEIQ
jgi:HD-like signal output (HDOD) protein